MTLLIISVPGEAGGSAKDGTPVFACSRLGRKPLKRRLAGPRRAWSWRHSRHCGPLGPPSLQKRLKLSLTLTSILRRGSGGARRRSMMRGAFPERRDSNGCSEDSLFDAPAFCPYGSADAMLGHWLSAARICKDLQGFFYLSAGFAGSCCAGWGPICLSCGPILLLPWPTLHASSCQPPTSPGSPPLPYACSVRPSPFLLPLLPIARV
jgi:hypothetical protein